jgi:hypothetical protein
VCIVSALSAPAHAEPIRRAFQPNDMQFEDPGLLEIDMYFGLLRGEDAYRVSAPDFYLSLGLTESIELDVSGEFAIGGPEDGEFVFDRTSPDNTWASLKFGLLDFGERADALAFGIQVGPQFPTAHDNRGLGFEGLLLLGWRVRDTSVVLNAGGFVDPLPDAVNPRPAGFEGGLDLWSPLDQAERWALTGEITGARYLTSQRDQLNFTLGITWSPSERLDVSVLALGSALRGGDRWGMFFALSPKVQLW